MQFQKLGIWCQCPSPSWAGDGDAIWNTTNYENGAAVRPIDRECIVQIHGVSRTSNILCEWNLKKVLVQAEVKGGIDEKICNKKKKLTWTVNWSIGEAAET